MVNKFERSIKRMFNKIFVSQNSAHSTNKKCKTSFSTNQGRSLIIQILKLLYAY